MIDSQSWVHLPRAARVGALALLLTTLLLALGLVAHFLRAEDAKDPKYTEWILIGMSVVQLTLSGLAVAVVLFYSEREANASLLEEKATSILAQAVPRVLKRVTADYEFRHQVSKITQLGASDIFGAAYQITSGPHVLKVWVGINVSRLFAIFWVAVPDDTTPEAFSKRLRADFKFTFGGAEKVGYHTYYEPAVMGGDRFVSIWSSVDSSHNLLLEPSKRVFWLQDLAMMIESFWRTLLRKGYTLSARDPSPL
jgi:hypothetical protein